MKYVILIVVSIVVFVTTIFLGKQASNYFAKASSCPAKNIRTEKAGANSGSIVWETDEKSQGRVEYGTNPQSLTFTSPEGEAARTHNVPLTLLTPNTIYYYLVAIGDSKCDSTGQKCEGNCVPYSFTTAPLVNTSVSTTPTPAGISAQPTSAQPTSTLTLFCRAVQTNIGKNSKAATEWASLKTYDIDGNGIINGLDVIKCQKSGK